MFKNILIVLFVLSIVSFSFASELTNGFTTPLPTSSGGTGNTSGASSIFAKQTTDVSVPATTDETTLYSVTIPANTIGINGTMRISTVFTTTSSANNKTMTLKFGGQTIIAGVLTTNPGVMYNVDIVNRNSASSQIKCPLISTNGTSIIGVIGTLTVDTTQDQILLVTGTKASAGETLTLNYIFIEVLK